MSKEEVEGREVVEIGARDVNGSIRPVIENWHPKKYVGVDIEKGKGVDVVCDAEKVLDKFGKESFDIVISNEMLEHVRSWRKVISNIKNLCRPGGIILITTRSKGFFYHGFPYDFWRFEISDMEKIFSDCDILKLEKDGFEPGVLMKAKKPKDFKENDLSEHDLFSIITGKIMKEFDDRMFAAFLEFIKNKKQQQKRKK
jgi:SAM-dependent methyltransferase